MILIRRYDHEHLAQSDAAYLRDRGVNAQVVNTHVNAMLGFAGLKWFQVQLVAPSRTDRDLAHMLLDELDAERADAPPPAPIDAPPDLSGIDTDRFPIDCPRCGRDLPVRASVTACPWCNQPVDPAQRLVMRYGPEVFDAAPDDPDDVDTDADPFDDEGDAGAGPSRFA